MTEERRQYLKQYYAQNKDKLAARKAWQQKHDLDYRMRAVLRTIVQRIEDPRHASYKWYGGQGIKNFLTVNDLKTLWVRDNANKMRKPSIDRRDVSKDYTFENCRFVELTKNLEDRRHWGTVTRTKEQVQP